ncbi:protein of unknown function DUF624 [Beutenbergia cavernae DSM 12333]|uniref:Uncharacterized protein n=1 Tax=Beutenbergia cavernae (strain ATCC BAA-8 / DSM 12333 / CCUG 43141 / JCM 11478 / NBRC 16432 / NCIMB 13614 / HKI 0122) TaxID=471853 RepID=C5BUV3_BEUC1|nr:DUF624 domain-containing protein [Beutenbergia cavernae]ACQ78327.1 protein of unknown function DUF624 [Beutenbergia cavernae DSM 12333]
MGAVLTWHQRLGRLGIQLLGAQLLWFAWTLRGGILLGAFPATAGVHAAARDVVLAHRRGAEPPSFRDMRDRVRRTWHDDFAVANRLGYGLALAWAFLVLDRRLVESVDLGGAAPVLAGLVTVLGIALGVVTVNAWVLQAHFTDGALALLRRGAVLAAARPAAALLASLGVAVVLCLYYLVPGLIPVFGVVAPAAVATASVWGSGVLTAPQSTPDATSGTPSSPLVGAR